MRFTLQTLLLFVAVVWTSMAAFGLAGFVLALIAFVFVACAQWGQSPHPKHRAMAKVLFTLIFGLFLLALLWPVPRHAGPLAFQAQCVNNLKQIGLALHNYHDTYRCFPPAYIPDADGKPMHSWRVLILPFVEHQQLFDQYDFNEPWDGPNNKKLAAKRLYVYECPWTAHGTQTPSLTNYMAVTGSRTSWPGADPIRHEDVLDDPANTIMVVEVADSSTNWMEPKDLLLDEAVRRIGVGSGQDTSNRHPSDPGFFYREIAGVSVLFADGSVRFLPEDVPPRDLEALLTIDGGESVDPSVFDVRRLDKSRCFALVALSLFVALLLYRQRKAIANGATSQHE